MPIPETKNTSEQDQQEKVITSELESSLRSELSTDFAKSLDLPASGEEEKKPEETEIPEETEEVQEEEAESTEEAEEGDAEGEIDEDLIPKSKVDKRFQQLTAEKKALEARLEAIEKETEAAKDPQTTKLEKMSEEELENLIDQVEIAKLEAIRGDDDAKYRDLVALGRNANKALRTAPQRFVKEQQKLFQEAAKKVSTDPEIEDIEKAGPEILQIANTIYAKSKAFQSRKDGQAEALFLAAEHHKEMSKLSSGKKTVNSDVNKLKRQNNKLKKKTSLDGKVMQGDMKRQALGKVKERAYSKNATIQDKIEFGKKTGIFGDLSRYGG